MDFLRGIDTSSGGGNNLIMGGGYQEGRGWGKEKLQEDRGWDISFLFSS
jgi:hypothetical protein